MSGVPQFRPGKKRGRLLPLSAALMKKKIKVRSGIYEPDVVLVLDSSLIGW